LDGQLCLNAPGYLELVEAYTREVLTMYPVDALRYDMLFSPKKCLCAGCKSYYQELYGEELTTWEGLALKGILNKDAIIVGQTLTSPMRRTIMALGARCYQYMPVNQRTALPDKRQWFFNDLAPFFQMVSEVQPYLEDATTLSSIGLVYAENTRFRYADCHRDAYMELCQQVAGAYLKRSLPLDFVNCLDLCDRDLARWRLLVLPATSGLTPNELDALRRYIRRDGNLLVAGDALRHDPRGMPQGQFDLADCLGLRFEGALEGWYWRNTGIGGGRAIHLPSLAT